MGCPHRLRVPWCVVALTVLTAAGVSEAVVIRASGTQRQSWLWRDTVPAAPTNWLGTVQGQAFADGGSGPGQVVPGTKLSYAAGTFTSPVPLTASSNMSGVLGSTASGSTALSATAVAVVGGQFVGQSTAVYVANLNPAAAAGASAMYTGWVKDPMWFDTDWFEPDPIPWFDLWLDLPAIDNDLPINDPNATWTASYRGLILDGVSTTDVDSFYGSPNLQTLYTLDLGYSAGMLTVGFTPGTPTGFTLAPTQSVAEIESALTQALIQGLPNNVTAFSAQVGFAGHNSFTLGFYSEFAAQAVPEPTSAALLGLGVVAVWRRRRKAG